MGAYRLLSFDYLKFFAIFLVVWGHCIEQLCSADSIEDSAYRFIYSFHMPLFMMISGYFSVSSLNLSVKSFVKKNSNS